MLSITHAKICEFLFPQSCLQTFYHCAHCARNKARNIARNKARNNARNKARNKARNLGAH